MIGATEIITIKQGNGLASRAVVTAPDEVQLVAAAQSAVAQGFRVCVQTDTALDGADPVALLAVLVNLGVAEIETRHVSQARRCLAMLHAIEAGTAEVVT